MDQIFTFFNQGWVGSVIGLVGIPIGYLIARHVRHKGNPCYQQSAHVLLGGGEDDLPSEVVIKYDGDDVKKLTRTSIIFWNHGTEMLNGEDIVQSDPLRLEFSDGVKILSAKIIKKTKVSNDFKLINKEGKENVLYLSYAYLDSKDGVSIEMLHDSPEKYPSFNGVIKGLPKGVFNFGTYSSLEYSKAVRFAEKKLSFFSRYFIYMLLFFSGFFTVGFGVFIEFFPEKVKAINSSAENGGGYFYMVFGCIYLAIPIVILWNKRIKYPKVLKLDR